MFFLLIAYWHMVICYFSSRACRTVIIDLVFPQGNYLPKIAYFVPRRNILMVPFNEIWLHCTGHITMRCQKWKIIPINGTILAIEKEVTTGICRRLIIVSGWGLNLSKKSYFGRAGIVLVNTSSGDENAEWNLQLLLLLFYLWGFTLLPRLLSFKSSWRVSVNTLSKKPPKPK